MSQGWYSIYQNGVLKGGTPQPYSNGVVRDSGFRGAPNILAQDRANNYRRIETPAAKDVAASKPERRPMSLAARGDGEVGWHTASQPSWDHWSAANQALVVAEWGKIDKPEVVWIRPHDRDDQRLAKLSEIFNPVAYAPPTIWGMTIQSHRDCVYICNDLTPSDSLHTVAHEIAHQIQHHRGITGSRQSVEAACESIAAMACRDLDNTECSACYPNEMRNFLDQAKRSYDRDRAFGFRY